jgi:hypothetical protein
MSESQFMEDATRTRHCAGISRNTVLLAFTSLFADISTEMLYPVLPIVGVEKVRDRNELFAAIVTAIEFFLSTSAKRRLAWEVLSVG